MLPGPARSLRGFPSLRAAVPLPLSDRSLLFSISVPLVESYISSVLLPLLSVDPSPSLVSPPTACAPVGLWA